MPEQIQTIPLGLLAAAMNPAMVPHAGLLPSVPVLRSSPPSSPQPQRPFAGLFGGGQQAGYTSQDVQRSLGDQGDYWQRFPITPQWNGGRGIGGIGPAIANFGSGFMSTALPGQQQFNAQENERIRREAASRASGATTLEEAVAALQGGSPEQSAAAMQLRLQALSREDDRRREAEEFERILAGAGVPPSQTPPAPTPGTAPPSADPWQTTVQREPTSESPPSAPPPTRPPPSVVTVDEREQLPVAGGGLADILSRWLYPPQTGAAPSAPPTRSLPTVEQMFGGPVDQMLSGPPLTSGVGAGPKGSRGNPFTRQEAEALGEALPSGSHIALPDGSVRVLTLGSNGPAWSIATPPTSTAGVTPTPVTPPSAPVTPPAATAPTAPPPTPPGVTPPPTAPPSAAPAPPVAPPSSAPDQAEPTIAFRGRRIPVSVAREIAMRLDLRGRRNEPLERAIADAEAPSRAAELAAAQERGKALGGAQTSLPQAVQSAESTLRGIDALLDDPNLGNITGWQQWGPLGYLPYSPGGRDTLARIGQIQGRSFLEAYQALRGGGTITETEGRKAQEAIGRLGDLSQSDVGYVTSLNDARREIWDLVNLARRRAGLAPVPYVPHPSGSRTGGGGPGTQAPQTPPPGTRLRYNPQTGQIE